MYNVYWCRISRSHCQQPWRTKNFLYLLTQNQGNEHQRKRNAPNLVKQNGDRTLKLEDGSIVSIARRNWKPLQQVATLEVPKLNVDSSDDAAEESEEPKSAPVAQKKLPVGTWMKVGLVVVFAAIFSSEQNE